MRRSGDLELADGAGAIARRIRAREVTVTDVTEDHVSRLEAVVTSTSQ